MTKTVSAYEARTNLGEITNLVYYRGIDVVVKKMDKPMVKITRFAEPKKKTSKENLLRLAGVWNNKDGEIIEKYAKNLRAEGKFISS